MNGQEFCYWLQGFFELSEGKKLTVKQTRIIKDHLALVFAKITPDRSQEIFKGDSITVEDFLKMVQPRMPDTIQPINPWPSPFPGVIPGINPLQPPYIVTCSTSEPKIPDSRPDCSNLTIPNSALTDEVYC